MKYWLGREFRNIERLHMRMWGLFFYTNTGEDQRNDFYSMGNGGEILIEVLILALNLYNIGTLVKKCIFWNILKVIDKWLT